MEILVYLGTPYKEGTDFVNPLIQDVIDVQNPVAVLSPSSAVNAQFISDRPDATTYTNVTWTDLLFPTTAAISPASMEVYAAQLLSKMEAFEYATENSAYLRTCAILNTAGFQNSDDITDPILAQFKESRVTIVRDTSPLLLICPKILASWFFAEFRTLYSARASQVIANADLKEIFQFAFENGDSTFLHLSEKYPSRVRVINIALNDETPASMLKLFAQKLPFPSENSNKIMFYILIALFVFFLFHRVNILRF